jgi:hypothetical protein
MRGGDVNYFGVCGTLFVTVILLFLFGSGDALI